jgi:hydroxyacylglutathione hydrolase
VVQAIKAGALVLDTRVADVFEKAFIPASINIGLNGGFAVWVGTLLSIERSLVIVAEEGRASESILRLARVGYENVVGYLEGGIEAWQAAGHPVDKIASIAPDQLTQYINAPKTMVVDVRKPSEFANGHVVGARNLELDVLESILPQMDPSIQYVIHCQGGYRSMVAASILKASGFPKVMNVLGGYAALSKTGIPLKRTPEVVA